MDVTTPDPPAWIHAHHRSLEEQFVRLVGDRADGREVLEIGCGAGGVAAHRLKGARRILATDPSKAAIQVARDFFRDQAHIEFMALGVADLAHLGRRFDLVVCREAIVQQPEPGALLAAAHASLRPGGCLVLSAPNRDSLHLRVNRLFGRPDFPCAGDHAHEFTYAEMQGLLAAAGFEEEEAVGVSLLPYHSVDGIFPDVIRHAEDHDAAFNEMLQELGRRAGPEYAFGYVIRARKA